MGLAAAATKPFSVVDTKGTVALPARGTNNDGFR